MYTASAFILHCVQEYCKTIIDSIMFSTRLLKNMYLEEKPIRIKHIIYIGLNGETIKPQLHHDYNLLDEAVNRYFMMFFYIICYCVVYTSLIFLTQKLNAYCFKHDGGIGDYVRYNELPSSVADIKVICYNLLTFFNNLKGANLLSIRVL